MDDRRHHDNEDEDALLFLSERFREECLQYLEQFEHRANQEDNLQKKGLLHRAEVR